MEHMYQNVWDSLPSIFSEISNRLKLEKHNASSAFSCLTKTFEGLLEFPKIYIEISKSVLADGVNGLKCAEKEYLMHNDEDDGAEIRSYKDTVPLLVNLLTDVVRSLSGLEKRKEIVETDSLILASLVEDFLTVNLLYLKDPDISCLNNLITSCKVCWEYLKNSKSSVLLSEIVPLQIRLADSFNLNEMTDNMLTVLRCLTELTSEVNVSLSSVLNSCKADNPYYLSIKATSTQFARDDQIIKLSIEDQIFFHLRKALKSADTKESKLSTFIIKSFTAFFAKKKDFARVSDRKNSQLLLHLPKTAFIKYWTDFFDLFEVLEEKQIHIIRPFFSKLKEIELESTAALEWYFVILYKMLQHDNRGVAIEGTQRFLKCSQNMNNFPHGAESQFLQFIEETLFPILRDQVGWIFKEGDEFFRYADNIGKLLASICNRKGEGKFFAANKIIKIIDEAEKGLSAHFSYFLVLTLDSAVSAITTPDRDLHDGASVALSFASNTLKLIARCINYSLGTIDKFMKCEIEKNLIRIFVVLLDLLGQFADHQDIHDSTTSFIGGLSNIFYQTNCFQELKHFPLKYTALTPVSLLNLNLNQLRGLLRWNLLCISMEEEMEIRETLLNGIYGFCLEINDIKHWSPVAVAATQDIFKGLPLLRTKTVKLQLSHDGFSATIFEEIWKILKSILIAVFVNGVSDDNFLNILKALNTIKLFCDVSETVKKYLVESMNIVTNKSKYVFQFGSSNTKDFVLCEMYLFFVETCGVRRDYMPNVTGFEIFFLSGNVAQDPNFSKNDLYIETFKENLACKYYQLKFRMFTLVVKKDLYNGPPPIAIQSSSDTWKKYISVGIDNMDLVGQSGVVAAAPFFYQCSVFVEHLDAEAAEKEKLTNLILGFVEISWRHMEEQRKTENFWKSFKAVVDYMTTCISINKTVAFLEFAKRTLEYKDIMGMSLVLMNGLKKSWKQSFVVLGLEYNTSTQKNLYQNILNMCISAASFGPSMVNTLTVDFNLWEILIQENSKSQKLSQDLLNANHFHSASQTRVLALMFVQMVLNCVLKLPTNESNFEEVLKNVVDKLLQENEEESLNRKRYFNNSTSHRRKQRIAQSLLILQYLFTPDIRRLVTTKLLEALANDSSQASVRYLMEWVIIRNLTCGDRDWDLFFEESIKCSRVREGFGAFFATICLHTAKLLENNSSSKLFFEKALKHLVDLLLGKHFTVKVYSLISFVRIYEIAKDRKWTSVIKSFRIVYDSLKNFSQTGNFAKIHQNIINDFYISIFDAATNYNYPMIFIHLPRISGMANDEIIPEPSLMALCDEFDRNFGSKLDGMPGLRCDAEVAKTYLKYQKSVWIYRPVVDGRELMEIAPGDTLKLGVPDGDVTPDLVNLQKKLNPWKFLPIGDISDFKEELQLRKNSLADDGLIVVASLIDRPPNLGGLCRTCEIFGVSKYVVSSLKIQDDNEFKNLSVSAHNWVDLLEVPVKDLEIFLASYASKGYTLIGVEQATESTQLQSYNFPKKSLLLLGNEKFGIPTNLLHLLNQCLEIPQVGVIRSLNVHVTGALCIYAYASQHVM